ncbi:porin [Phascolarctobacterium sp.]|uniref:porin n=1 Tax=Phascolarctobacterium sp. TaxID=2049039 RepID=UPI0038634177
MKKSLVLAMAMALGVTASAYAANPFSDVPAGHWAYDSINKLAAAGVIDGYGDATFGGDKLMTRYEMAQIVAKAMAKGANVDKLAAEFADELDNLGVRVANLEKKADNVKITGEVRYAYADNDKNDKNTNYNKLRSRIWFAGQVNEDWTYTGMIQNEQNLDNNKGDETTDFQRAYVNGKIGGLKVQAGRYNMKVADGNVYDNRFDGVQASYGKDIKLVAGYGKADPGSGDPKAEDTYYAELSGKLGALSLMAGYYNFEDIGTAKDAKTTGIDQDIWAVNAEYAFDKNFKLGAMYLNGDKDGYTGDDDGYVVTASYKGAKASKPGSWGIVAKYYDQGASTYVDHTMDGLADDEMFKGTLNENKTEGFKGYSVAADYALAKNIVAKVQWFDLESKEGEEDAETLWGQVVFTF